jgi:predicted DNA-binding protein
MHTITFDNETEKRLNDLAQQQGVRPDHLIQDLVEDYLQEIDDAEAAYQRYLAGEEKAVTPEALSQEEPLVDLDGAVPKNSRLAIP